MDTKKINVIFNPTAGGGLANKLRSQILAWMTKRFGDRYTLAETHFSGEATILSRNDIANGAGLIIAVGGDGTIQEVVNGFFNDGATVNPGCELGIIDCGTGSGLAQSLDLPASMENQIDLIYHQQSCGIDVGRIVFRNRDRQREQRMFVSECQIGIGSAVVAGVQSMHKRFGGTLAFGSVAFSKVIGYKAQTISLQFDNERKMIDNLIGIVIGNGNYCGGGMRLTPTAQLNDGLLDVLTIHNMGVITRLLNFPKIYWGKHVDSPYFNICQCKKVIIDAEEPIPIAADGEMLGMTPCEIDILPAALKIKSRLPYEAGSSIHSTAANL